MNLPKIPHNLAVLIERRSILFIIIGVIITALLAPGLFQLKTETGMDTMLKPGNIIFDDTKEYEDQFGAETNIVLIQADVDKVFTSENLKILQEFERQFSTDERIQSIISPVTIVQIAKTKAIELGIFTEDQLVDPLENQEFIHNVTQVLHRYPGRYGHTPGICLKLRW